MPSRTRYILNKLALLLIACALLCIGLFCVAAEMMPVNAASIGNAAGITAKPCNYGICSPTPTPTKTRTKTPTPTPTKPPTPSPTPKPTPTQTPRPRTTPTPGSNNLSPTPTIGSVIPTASPTPAQTPLPQGPVPAATATARAKQAPTRSLQSTGGGPPTTGGNSGGPSTGMMVTYAALALALLAFLLYLIPQGQTPLLVKLLSLVLPSSVARRFGARMR